MSHSSMSSVGPRRIAGSSSDGKKKRPTSPPRSLLAPPCEDEEEEIVLQTPPAVYPSEVQMYVAIDRMVVTLFRSFELSPEI